MRPFGSFFFKQKTAYDIVSRDWSSDVCSSDLQGGMPDGEITEKEGDRHRTDEHRCNKRRYVSLAEELDACRHELARRQLHYPLGYRHEDRRNRGVETVHQLRDP